MTTGIAPPQRPASTTGPGGRYRRTWSTVTMVVAAVWVALAVLQTPLLPLAGLAAGLGAYGGIFFVKAPASTAEGRWQYVTGALTVAGLVLVAVGFRHHLEAAFLTSLLMTGTSPPVVRWITRG